MLPLLLRAHASVALLALTRTATPAVDAPSPVVASPAVVAPAADSTASTLPPVPARLEGADSIVVWKSQRAMLVFRDGVAVRFYQVALGRNPEGRKIRKGDRRTPEGVYRISGKNPSSAYHRALRISYPNDEDRARAARLGVSPGGDVMIHGLPPAFADVGPAHVATDWTYGCIAVTDAQIDELYAAIRVGTVIHIKP